MQKTVVYFIRHAEPNYHNHDDMSRELTDKGMKDSQLVTQFLSDKNVDIVLSSPYKRAIDTIKDFAETYGFDINVVSDFRERKVGSEWIEDFQEFCKAQWHDFYYKRTDGESLGEVQKRNISALNDVLKQYAGKTIVVGSHGTALSSIIHYYDKQFGYSDFEKIRYLMPWAVKFVFYDHHCVEIQQYNLFDMNNSCIERKK